MIPIGVDDFGKLREGGFYYVDKTELISDIVNDLKEVFLFTRPRRFGKSLNLSMLDCFFNLKYRGNNWFDGLKVMEDPKAVSMMNSRPVIKFEMKGLSVDDMDSFLSKLSVNLLALFVKYDYLESSDRVNPHLLRIYEKAVDQELNKEEKQVSLKLLCSMLHAHHGIKPIILIDEYDEPINSAFGQDSYPDILKFLRGFYSDTLKTNDSLEFAVVTGVMQIAKETIFSGLNNLNVNNVLSTECDERFGFTESEVRTICEAYGRPDAFGTAREWYDGYRFGDAEIYNPWSVMKFINEFKSEAYWAGTSGNDIIGTLIADASDSTFDELQILGNGGTVTGKTIRPTVVMNDLSDDPDDLYSVLVMSGYLNAVPDADGEYVLSVPNREMYDVFTDAIVSKGLKVQSAAFRSVLRAVQRHDIAKMEEKAFEIFRNFQDWDLVGERSYRQIIAAAAMCCCGRYTVSTEGQDGNGRADMLMRRNTPAVPNIVIEFKKSESEDSEKHIKEAEEGLRQIKRRQYFASLRGRTLLYGISMNNKMAKVLSEELDL